MALMKVVADFRWVSASDDVVGDAASWSRSLALARVGASVSMMVVRAAQTRSRAVLRVS